MSEYTICKHCIMDTSDPLISFDSSGICSNCNTAFRLSKEIWFPDDRGSEKLNEIFDRIKKSESSKEYDCIIGLSGGVDSSYLAYIAVKNGIRPLIVHVDCGWNSEQAVRNIENIVNKLNLDLHTLVVNWEEMKDLQRSFFLASLPDQDIPQDHAIFAALYSYAEKNNVRYVFSGHNFATESINPEAWGHQAMDYRHIRAIQKRFGTIKLKEYPHVSFFRRYIYFNLIRRMMIINPLNYIRYNKKEAMDILQRELGWQYYGGKHYESRFTKFFQSYYLPVKFNIDKRRSHLSSLIISGQISREEALRQIGEKSYDDQEIMNDMEYVAKKLDWTLAEFRSILNLPPGKHEDFPVNTALFRYGIRAKQLLRKITSK